MFVVCVFDLVVSVLVQWLFCFGGGYLWSDFAFVVCD